MDEPTWYEVLGVARTASQDEIKAAFRALAKSTHPDLNPGDPSAAERFQRVNAAWEVLRDPDRRAHYDLDLIEAAQRTAKRPRKPPPRYYGSKPPETWPRDPIAHLDEIRRRSRSTFGSTQERWQAERAARQEAEQAKLNGIRRQMDAAAKASAERARAQEREAVEKALRWAEQARKRTPPPPPAPTPDPRPVWERPQSEERMPWEDHPEAEGPLPWETD